MLRKLSALVLGMVLVGTVAAQRPAYRIGDVYEGPSTGAVVAGSVYQGEEIAVDLPESEHVRNFGAPKDGKGLCVFASMMMGARWHNISELFDVIHKVPYGGGWPDKVDQVIHEFAPTADYLQYTGGERARIDKMIDRAILGRRPVCVTYGYGERYRMQTIAHMVLLVHASKTRVAILDNNFPATYEWMDRDEFYRRFVHPNGQGWLYFFLEATPPPLPSN